MADRRGLRSLIRASARQERLDRLTAENISKKRGRSRVQAAQV